MIKGTATTEGGGTLHLLGISQANVDRLQAGQPIRVDLSEIGGEGTVVIFYGQREVDLVEQLREVGIVTAETQLHIDPRLSAGREHGDG